MKHLVTSVAAAGILAMILPAGSSRAAAAQSSATASVLIVKVSPTVVTAKHAVVTFRLRVKGLVLDSRHLGRANTPGHGHIQLYADKVPGDAYSKKDLKHHWLASLASPDFTLKLTPAILGGPGKHRIIIALAQNNYVLYRAPTASVTLTAK